MKSAAKPRAVLRNSNLQVNFYKQLSKKGLYQAFYCDIAHKIYHFRILNLQTTKFDKFSANVLYI